MSRAGYVYILSNHSRTLYTGVTNNLERRMYEHKRKIGSQFAAKYNLTQLVYYESLGDIREAIAREKQTKGWRRERKIALIELANPDWKDLTTGWDLALPHA